MGYCRTDSARPVGYQAILHVAINCCTHKKPSYENENPIRSPYACRRAERSTFRSWFDKLTTNGLAVHVENAKKSTSHPHSGWPDFALKGRNQKTRRV